MFRPMRRFKQQISGEECVRILKEEPRGVLSVLGDDGYPYGVPLDHYYDEESGKLYFHCAPVGHKMDAVLSCDKVSYCVLDRGYRREGEWALNISSVICFGRIRPLTDRDQILAMVRKLSLKYTDDLDLIEKDIERNGARVACLELTIEHMTGKLVNES